MKKLSALIMFTLLATAGYYIGNAVAQNKTSADQQALDGVLVVEETYGVAVPVQAASPTADSAAGSAAGTDATTPGSRRRPTEKMPQRRLPEVIMTATATQWLKKPSPKKAMLKNNQLLSTLSTETSLKGSFPQPLVL